MKILLASYTLKVSQDLHGSVHHTLRTDDLKYLWGLEGQRAKLALEVLNPVAKHMAGCELMFVEWTRESIIV